jgi:hypothetical protein
VAITFVLIKPLFMEKLPAVKALWDRVKKPNQSLDELSKLLQDYEVVLKDVCASSDDYKNGLRRQIEELPDLQRLVGKKHGPILQGRIQDGTSMLKKKVEAVELPSEIEEPRTGTLGADSTVVSLQEEERKPFRNIPTLGMD